MQGLHKRLWAVQNIPATIYSCIFRNLSKPEVVSRVDQVAGPAATRTDHLTVISGIREPLVIKCFYTTSQMLGHSGVDFRVSQ